MGEWALMRPAVIAQSRRRTGQGGHLLAQRVQMVQCGMVDSRTPDFMTGQRASRKIILAGGMRTAQIVESGDEVDLTVARDYVCAGFAAAAQSFLGKRQ